MQWQHFYFCHLFANFQCNLTSVIQSIEDLPKAMAVVLQKLKLDYEPSAESSCEYNH